MSQKLVAGGGSYDSIAEIQAILDTYQNDPECSIDSIHIDSGNVIVLYCEHPSAPVPE